MDACMFTGHRALPKNTRPLADELIRQIERVYGRGIRAFVSGGAMGFDMLAAETVLSLRDALPGVTLGLMLPCRNQHRFFSERDKARYQALLAQADRTVYVSEEYHSGCMHERNRAMVDGARVCLCYLTHARGGTAYTVRYALGRGLDIINLAELTRGEAED